MNAFLEGRRIFVFLENSMVLLFRLRIFMKKLRNMLIFRNYLVNGVLLGILNYDTFNKILYTQK